LPIVDAGVAPLLDQAPCDVTLPGPYAGKKPVKLKKYPFRAQYIAPNVLFHLNKTLEIRGIYAAIIEWFTHKTPLLSGYKTTGPPQGHPKHIYRGL